MKLRILTYTLILVSLILIFRPSPATAQEELPEDTVITVSQLDVSQYPEITIYVNVTDEDGNPLPMLDEENFTVTEDDEEVNIVDFKGIGESRPVDVVFVFDTTGSMGGEIDAMVATSINFAQELEDSGRDYRLGLVTFGDEIRGVYYPDLSLTDDAVTFQDWMDELNADGGGENPENDYGALKQATQMQFRSDSQVIFVLITDDTVHHSGDAADEGHTFEDPDLNLEPILAMLGERATTVHVVSPDLSEFRQLAEETSGSFYDIAANPDFTGIITDIGETIANQYRITYRSPREAYDGTRRDVRVAVGEAETAVEYLEEHLLNIQSELWIGAVCLLPMLAGLGLLPLIQLFRRPGKAAPLPSPASPAGSSAAFLPTEQPSSPIMSAPAALPPAPGGAFTDSTIPMSCPHCAHPVRPGAQFCARCGNPLPSPNPPRHAAPTQVEPRNPPGISGAPTLYSPSSQATPPAVPQAGSSTACPSCGHQLRPGAKFCPNCGNKT